MLMALADREKEGLNLYTPLPGQPTMFHASTAKERIVRGSVRAGKTLVCAVELARAVTGTDPFNKYPKRDGLAIIVAPNLRHIGKVIYPKLFGVGSSFQVIKDPKSGQWRAFDPEVDIARKNDATWANPLIPSRLVPEDNIAWYERRSRIPASVKIAKTGWEILFCSADARPVKGLAADLVFFDEEIVDTFWYEEMASRLVDRAGCFIWSCNPDEGGEQLYRLHTRYIEGDPDVQEFHLTLAKNKYIGDTEKDKLRAKYTGEVARVRIEGEYGIESYRVYPEFKIDLHGYDYFPVPANWTRFAMVDPGRQICAVLFAAVPPMQPEGNLPPEWFGDYVYFYDELYLAQCSAEKFGREMARVAAADQFEVFFIDPRSGSVHEMGTGKTVQEQYSEALAKHGIKSEQTGSSFKAGSTDWEGALERLRSWFAIRPDFTCKLRIMLERCPNMKWELDNYRWQRLRRADGSYGPSNKPRDEKDHLIWGARTIAAYGPSYIQPKEVPKSGGIVYDIWRERQKRRKLHRSID